MRRNIKLRLVFAALIFAMPACNLPRAAPQSTEPDIQTAAALTVQSILTPSTASTPTVQQFIVEVNSSTPAPTATITPTYSTPMLTVLEQTNCRTGPGQDYEITFTYLPNAKLIILGRYDIEDYWLVKSDESPAGQCWLWGEYVQVSGSYWAVSSVTPPPTSTQPPPNAPSFQSWDYTCAYNGVNNDLNVTLRWSDRSNNEAGYRVFRDGGLVADLPAGSTAYADQIAVNSGQGVGYRVEAYNAAGAASTSTITITCP